MDDRTCRIAECTVHRKKFGFCQVHFKSWDSDGRPGGETCYVEGCGRGHYSNGLCQSHQKRVNRGISLDTAIRDYGVIAGRSCTYPGCSRPRASIELCEMHSKRRREGRSMDEPPHERTPDGLCSLGGCQRAYYALGLCQLHYGRKKTGTPLDIRSASGKTISSQGYVLVWVGRDYPSALKTGYISEHRFVMEGILGRHLTPDESVHHINGVKTDNSPENLELWVTSQPSGQRPADLVAWALKILERYGDEPLTA